MLGVVPDGNAFAAPDGRRAWPLGQAPAAAEQLGEHGFAVLGLQVWLVLVYRSEQAQSHTPVIPVGAGKATMMEWALDDSIHPGESWRSFCQRSVGLALDALKALRVTEQAEPRVHPLLYVHFDFVDEAEYNE